MDWNKAIGWGGLRVKRINSVWTRKTEDFLVWRYDAKANEFHVATYQRRNYKMILPKTWRTVSKHIITEFDLVKTIYDPGLRENRVADLMPTDVLSVEEDSLLSDIVRIMEDHRIRCLPVVRDRQIVGLITRRDLLRHLTQNADALCTFLEQVRPAATA